MLVVAHRVHECDLSAHLMQDDDWKNVVLPLIAIADQTYKTSAGVWHRRKGDLLRPGSFSARVLDRLRAKSFNPDFGMLYQQDVESQGLPAFTPDHFPSFSDTSLMPGPVVLSVETPQCPARPRSAYSVIQAWRLAGGCFLPARSVSRADRFYQLA